MNIGIFTDTYDPKINGVVTSIRTLEQELTSLGHNVYIFTTSPSKGFQRRANVYYIPSMPLAVFADHKVGILYPPRTLRIVKRLKLDVIHSQTEFSLGLFAKLAAKRYRIPHVHTYHTMYEDYVHYLSKLKLFNISEGFARKYSKLFCNSIDTIIAPTEKTRHFLTSYGITKPIRVIPTGISFEPFKKSSFNPADTENLRAQYGITRDQPVIVFVGRLAKEKSVDVVIRAIPELLTKMPEARLFIVGNGPAMSELKALAAELEISHAVIFSGEQKWDEIGRFYQVGDVFVSASTTETQGLTFAEAMAGGIPVIAKKDDSTAGLLEDRINGRIFTEDNQLSQIFYDLLSDKVQQEALVKQAYISVEQFSSETFGRSVERLYSELGTVPLQHTEV